MADLISKRIRGFRDILPEESKKFLLIENVIHRICPLFDTHQVKIPALESANLFNRSIGETSDIVTKEMYSFKDKNDDMVCMIPEGTASCMRLAFENNLIYDRGIKKNRLYYYAPMFRHERPQKGRYRQFTQFGVEFIGDKTISDDIDLILMSCKFFAEIGLTDISLHINNLGSNDDREKYASKLQEYFNRYSKSLSDNQKNTLIKNPLRLLDNKDNAIREIIENAPNIKDSLNNDSIDRFEQITDTLNKLNIKFTLDNKLVRGLDYYNDLVFEWKTRQLGTQDAICAGGRYDGLAKIIGGLDIPAVGLAIGVDRVVELLACKNKEITIGLSLLTSSLSDCSKIITQLREIDYAYRLIKMESGKSLTKQIKSAVKQECDILVIVGDEEISNNTLTVKYLKDNKNDESISIDKFLNILEEY
ncbi:MAG: histidine--tRNA ligase [Pseudomonadota bacterium]|nr:histidine--tRNA ligase [Pseudomonadota bacterium]|tara:strand:- start:462 stop:1721 length:1260 start_codon:yes stop_codon:yes gene_type:complete